MAINVTDYQSEKLPSANNSPWHYVRPVLLTTLDANGNVIVPLTDPETGALLVEDANKQKAHEPYYRDYGITGLSSSGWLEIVASVTAKVTRLHIFDSSGFFVRVGIGAGSGLNDLGDGVQVGLTVELLGNWQIKFPAGNYIAKVSGGNLIGGPAGDPIAYSAGVQTLLIQSAASTVVSGTGGGATVEEIERIGGMLDKTFKNTSSIPAF
jgi:hypothetical protein